MTDLELLKRFTASSEVSFGADVDEAIYRRAMAQGDREAIARCDAAASDRMRRVLVDEMA